MFHVSPLSTDTCMERITGYETNTQLEHLILYINEVCNTSYSHSRSHTSADSITVPVFVITEANRKRPPIPNE